MPRAFGSNVAIGALFSMAGKKATGKAKPKGAPRKYSDAQIEAVIDAHAEGIPFKTAGRQAGIPWSALWKRVRNDERLGSLYAGARESYAESKVSEIHDIAETEEDVQRARLRIDSIKWEAAKVLPKFADKSVHEVTGKDGGPMEHRQRGLSRQELIEELQARGLPTKVFDE